MPPHAGEQRIGASRRPRTFYGPVLLAAGLYACILAYEVISAIVLSFLLILFISLAINPLVVRLRETFGRRSVGVVIVLVGFLVGATLAAVALYTPVRNSGPKLFKRVSGYWQKIQEPLAQMDGQLTNTNQTDSSGTNENLPNVSASSDQPKAKQGVFQSVARESFNTLVSSFQKFALNIVSLLIIGITVFFGTMFTLLNPYPIIGVCFAFVPERHHSRTVDIFKRIALFVPRWAVATLLSMLIIGTLIFLTMWPLLGLANAFTLGIISGTLEMVPYLGAIVSSVPGLILALSKDEWTPLWVLIAYIAVYSVEANLIVPLIMADRLDVHPVAVLFSVFLCGAAFGVLGVLIAVPVLVVVQILYDELYRPRFLPHVSQHDLDQMARAALQPNKGKK